MRRVTESPELLRRSRWRPSRWRKPAQDVERFVEGNAVQLFTDCGEVFDVMLGAIEGAKVAIWFEMYWFESKGIGQVFLEALGRAADRGVQVRLLVDAFGSFGADRSAFERLRQRGASVAEFHPLHPFQRRARLGRLTVRNHRKLVLMDFRRAFVGGLNIADQWLPRSQGGEGWRDDVVRVEGPVVLELARSFAESWREACDEPIELPQVRIERVGHMPAAVLAHTRSKAKRQTLRAYIHRLRRAEKQILIANAYFLPNLRIRAALVNALRRGVDVRIMLPGRSDVELVRYASRAVWGRLLRQGARIFEWQPSMMHSKTAVIDGEWVTTGSFNLDYVSIRNNRELNVSILDPAFAEIVREAFYRDLEQCSEVDLMEFKARSWGQRVIERVAYGLLTWI